MPADSVEAHVGDEFLFGSDELAFNWKFRGDGHFVWANTVTLPDGTIAGPASIVAQR